jgi:hypothetical protein
MSDISAVLSCKSCKDATTPTKQQIKHGPSFDVKKLDEMSFTQKKALFLVFDQKTRIQLFLLLN